MSVPIPVAHARLPTELLALVASFVSNSSLKALALVSRTAYAISVGRLYNSIPCMNATRTIQCLHTLASNDHLARLVRAYSIKGSKNPPRPESLCGLLKQALRRMVNLTELSLQLGLCGTSRVFKNTIFKLRKLVCVVVSDPSYPVSRFLNSQSGLKSLYLVCRADGLPDLSYTALPLLQEVAAPLCLLPLIISTRLNHLVRISSLGTITKSSELRQLARTFCKAPTRPLTPNTIELVLGLDLSARTMSLQNVEISLATLGMGAPWIGLLRLEVHQGRVERKLLTESIASALHYYPSLHTLAILSQPPNGAYIHPDAIHDTTHHNAYLYAWRKARPSLERVVLPIGVYTYVKKPEPVERGMICDGKNCETCRRFDWAASARIGQDDRANA